MAEESFFTKFKLERYDRILFFAVIITHIIAIFEPIKEFIKEHTTADAALVFYVIAVSAFWTAFTIYFCSKQIRSKDAELYEYKEQTNIHTADLENQIKNNKNAQGYIDAYQHFTLAFAKIHSLQRKMQSMPVPDDETKLWKEQIAFLISDFGRSVVMLPMVLKL